jgi:hypothetical protein
MTIPLGGFRFLAATSSPRAFCQWLILLTAAFTVWVPRVEAGCGCDHPPPLRGVVYPRFAWPDSLINVYAPGSTSPQPCVRIGGKGGKMVQALNGLQPQASNSSDFCAAGLKPQVLTMEYTGADCKASSNSQGIAARCAGWARGVAHVHIVAQQAMGNSVWFDGEVNLHDSFDIDAKNAERLELIGADTAVTISDIAGRVLQTITLRTNCAEPLNPGDQFGALVLRGFTAAPKAPDEAEAVVPDIAPGPQPVEVFDGSCDTVDDNTVPLASAPPEGFTVLARPVPVLEMEGTVRYQTVGAVAADGTLLIAFDMTRVMRAMQFFSIMKNLPLRFTTDDVTYYNKDQYNLKMFTSRVANPDEYMWGRYYGTTVDPSKTSNDSNVIGYWRHEFETYLVAAIKGHLVDPKDPTDQTKWSQLTPGKITLNMSVLQLFTDGPVQLSMLTPYQQQCLQGSNFQVMTDSRFNMLQQVIALPTNAWR